ncbi:MAG: hypothetical protein JW881_12395 [Spirochaetales bacterium]|nr:hypothetical protein [Spirochaetales bacterium]
MKHWCGITFALLLLGVTTHVSGISVYVSSLNSSYKSYSDLTQESHKRKTDIISILFKKVLTDHSTGDLTFKDLSLLEKEKPSFISNEPVTDNLDALAICFFHKVDYVLYGELFIENDEKRYIASIKIYSKIAGDTVFSTDMVKDVSNEEEFVDALAERITIEFGYKYAEIKTREEKTARERAEKLREEIGEPEIAEKEKETETGEEEGKATISKEESDLLAKIEKLLDEKESGKEVKEEVVVKDIPGTVRTSTEKIMSFHISAGYFYTVLGEWKDVVFPCVSLEEGIKWSLLLVNTATFDFYLRPAILIDYSFAIQSDDNAYHRYVHYHSLTGKLLIEAFFEFGDFFGFFIGASPHYKLDIIDFRTHFDTFYTDIPYAFGVSGNLGCEFALNREKTFNMGLNVVTNITFFDTLYLDIKAYSHILLKF